MFSSSGLTTTFALIFALAFSLSELPLDFPDFNDFSFSLSLSFADLFDLSSLIVFFLVEFRLSSDFPSVSLTSTLSTFVLFSFVFFSVGNLEFSFSFSRILLISFISKLNNN